MVSIHQNKRSIEPNELRKLLSQTNVQTIGDNLFTESTTQKGKKMEMKTKKRRKLPVNNQKHIERKQDPFL